MPKLTVQLVSWNGEKYIPFLFKSLREQTFTDWELRVLDNNSSDKTLLFIKEASKYLNVPVTIAENKENKGFAGGHNQIWRESETDYLLLLNQDMYLEKNCLAKLVEFMDANPEYGSVTPRLMHWNFNVADENLEKSFGEIIDSLGLKVFRNRRVVEFRSGDEWNPAQLTHAPVSDVFGVSGALPMYRRAALKEVMFNDGTFFDGSYHSYKEDVDLAFRLRSGGFEAAAILESIAWHDRGAAGSKELSDVKAAENKKKQSAFIKYYSYRNQLATIYKNEYGTNFLLDLPWILWYELKKFGYFLLFDRAVLKGLIELFRERREYRLKRGRITECRKISYKDLRLWWML